MAGESRGKDGAARAHLLAARVLLAVAIGLGTWGLVGLAAGRSRPEPESAPGAPAASAASAPSPAQGPIVLPSPAPAFAAFAQSLDAAHEEVHRIFRQYVTARVVAVEVDARLPRRFEPWEASDDYEASEASSAGLLTCWKPDWYVTHEWSAFGRQILALVPGDVIEINGRTAKVEGLYDYPKASYSDEIYELVGFERVILQTCEPASDLNRIVYASWTDA